MRRARKSMAQMNVVPYIDVMLVLLVIFMVTAPMMQAGVAIDAPDADASPLQSDNQQEPLIILVDQRGQYLLQDGDTLNAKQLTTYVKEQLAGKRNRAVNIRADAGVEYQYVMTAMVAAQRAGATAIHLLADPVKPK
ncbi:ExbD/TolR family protein [Thiothrix eikelboomii]|uniref:Biopolymer transport protein TolR n=1 Tax=Thiothrix eikelboomii TaxID=92487 RepID=A0A1T4X7Q1_9GAMM|nr:ExbD/TolR family protein [Thiothrix eikelboomii]SKA85138.1 biopolymer transport protein TolR [Thiothrix eikelboomii]